MSKPNVLDVLEAVIDHDNSNMLEAFGIALGDEGTMALAKLVRKAAMYMTIAPTKSQALEEIIKGKVFNEEDTRVITLFFIISGSKDILKFSSK